MTDAGAWIPILADDDIFHVYPTFGREHVTDKGADCWCHPKVEGQLVIHEVEQ